MTPALRVSAQDHDVDDEYDPSLTPFPFQICSECHHRADRHRWVETPESQLIKPYERSGRRLVCSVCPPGRPACVAIAETTL